MLVVSLMSTLVSGPLMVTSPWQLAARNVSAKHHQPCQTHNVEHDTKWEGRFIMLKATIATRDWCKAVLNKMFLLETT